MCICLPNGKFSFKFSKTQLCLGRKESNKHKSNLICETSDDEDINHNGCSKTNGVHLKLDTNLLEPTNGQGHYHQQSRDRQLPPVPDLGGWDLADGAASPRRGHSNASFLPPPMSRSDIDVSTPGHHQHQQGTVNNSGYACFTIAAVGRGLQYPPDHRIGMRNSDLGQYSQQHQPALYSTVLRCNNNTDYEKPDIFCEEYGNGNHGVTAIENGYSIIRKDGRKNVFNSLRKTDRARPVLTQCCQSLQALDGTDHSTPGPAPCIPRRQYSPCELPISLREPGPATTSLRQQSSLSLLASGRRLSQPRSLGSAGRGDDALSLSQSQQQTDSNLLKNLQSQFNTPPLIRASLGDVRAGSVTPPSQPPQQQPQSAQTDATKPDRAPGSPGRALMSVVVEDAVYSLPHKTLGALTATAASIASTSAAPPPTPLIHHNLSCLQPSAPTNVYEMVDEVMPVTAPLTNSQPPTRLDLPDSLQQTHPSPSLPSPQLQNHHHQQQQQHSPITGHLYDVPTVAFVGHDNYISLADTIHHHHHSANAANAINSRPSLTAATDAPSLPNGAGQPYSAYTCGSDVYAEISDVYQSRQYEELPDSKPSSAGQTTSATGRASSLEESRGKDSSGTGAAPRDPSASPGTIRVLLEIQNFRHMDSDIDVSSSLCATPLHPGQHLHQGAPRAGFELLSSSLASGEAGISSGGGDGSPQQSVLPLRQHPWFLPPRHQQGSLTTTGPLGATAAASGQTAFMTPLMERSMEVDVASNTTSTHMEWNLYDLLKRDSSPHRNSRLTGNLESSNGRRALVNYPSLADNQDEFI